MRSSFKFSNLLGTVYTKGNVAFAPDGSTLISPVGNRVSAYDLKSNRSETLPVECRYNITTVAISPNGNLMLLVNEEGESYLCSLLNKTLISQYNFMQRVDAVSFSPDASMFAATKGNQVLLFQSPGYSKCFNPFVLLRTFYGPYDSVVSIDWTSDSRVLCAGSLDMNTHVFAARPLEQLVIRSVGGHRDAIVTSAFLKNSLDMITVSRDKKVCYWKCNYSLENLTDKDSESSPAGTDDTDEKLNYSKASVFSVKESSVKQSSEKATAGYTYVTSAAFHKQCGILVSALSDGSFFLHEMPGFTHIHSLSVGSQAIDSVVFNSTGDWLALACSKTGQLVVWEWQSESYVMKQSSHYNAMSCVSYSPDGQCLVTGDDDHKVKLWKTSTGFCYVTFTEHTGAVTNVLFTQNGKVVISASLDGTVRAYDLHRYRNFRTFTSPRQSQFASLAVDPSGEMVCAGAADVFDIFLWSMRTGKLLEIIAGHEAPVSGLVFSPLSSILVSASWDHTVKIWDVMDAKGNRETIQLSSDCKGTSNMSCATEFVTTV